MGRVFPGETDTAVELHVFGRREAVRPVHATAAALAATGNSGVHPARQALAYADADRAPSTSTSRSASRCLTAWNEPMARPN